MIVDKVFPLNSKRRIVAKKIYNKLKRFKGKESSSSTSTSYDAWILKIESTLWVTSKHYEYTPVVSVVVPAFNTPEKYIQPLIDSLLAQTYENWELCIADASTNSERADRIALLSKIDKRIVYKRLQKNLGIAGNTNEALKIATGDFIGLLDHDDILSPHAIREVIDVLNKDEKVDVIYSDEDKLSDDGTIRQLPFFKPDWSPDLLLGVNYITHFLVIRKTLIDALGGIQIGFDGAQDYDLLLRVTEKTENIVHIPKILYHWRLADGSTAKTVGEKSYADDAGQRALRGAVKRRNIKAEVVDIPEQPTNYRLRYMLPAKQPKVSIIIPFKDRSDLLKQCVGSILDKTTYKNYEIILLSNNSKEEETRILVEELVKDNRIKAYIWDHPFNYSKINNYGVTKARGEYIVLLNNDTEVITPEWLEELVGVAIQPGVGVVGPMLLYPEHKNGIQHAGIILGMGTMAGHVFRHRKPLDWTDFGMPAWPRNYLAVTGACLVVSKKLYQKMGGLDEIFTIAGQDVAFGIKLSEAGYRNIYWPFARLYHYESISVGTYNNGIQLDYDHSLTYYKKYHENGDRYYNKNLDLMNEQVGIGGAR